MNSASVAELVLNTEKCKNSFMFFMLTCLKVISFSKKTIFETSVVWYLNECKCMFFIDLLTLGHSIELFVSKLPRALGKT